MEESLDDFEELLEESELLSKLCENEQASAAAQISANARPEIERRRTRTMGDIMGAS